VIFDMTFLSGKNWGNRVKDRWDKGLRGVGF
jgi:hypothetical protein